MEIKNKEFRSNEEIGKKQLEESHVKYINLYFFEIKASLLFTYMYLFASIMLNLVNRKLFSIYNFKFSFTLIMLQQIMGIICFQILFTRFENYRKNVGEVSLREFRDKKYPIIVFAMIFLLNVFSSFIGNQKVNTQMFLCLRKYLLIFNFLFDLLINKKSLPNHFTSSVIMITLGSTLSSVRLYNI